MHFGVGGCDCAYTSEIDIIINKNFIPKFFVDTNRTHDLPSNSVDLYRTLLHELGHAHSLAHVNDTNEIMYFGQRSPKPAQFRHIVLNECPFAFDAGDFVLDHSLSIDTSACKVELMIPTPANCTRIGIEELGIAGDIKVYPNPTSENCMVNIDLEKSANRIIFSVYDLTGRLFYQNKSSLRSSQYLEMIPIAEIQAGYYLLDINIDGQSFVTKIVKQ